MYLQDLLYDWPDVLPSNPWLTGLSFDTRQLQPGQAFIALQGWQFDGRCFIDQAIQQGASVILESTTNAERGWSWYGDTLCIYWPNIQQSLSELAARFYNYPGQYLQITGVTGTNGKTSIAHLLSQAKTILGKPCLYSGSLGQGTPNNLQATTYGLTTPDAIDMQRLLLDWYQQGYHHIAMEVSSHALDLGRVNAVPFANAIFSNISHDHLDYHGSMEHYIEAKSRLFKRSSLNAVMLNADDSYSSTMYQAIINPNTRVCYYSIDNEPFKSADAFIKVSSYDLSVNGIDAQLESSWGKGELNSQLLGRFNLANLLAVMSALCMEGFEWHQVLKAIAQCQPVPGRMESIRVPGQPAVVVDYAHTPDALEQMLITVRSSTASRLYCIFGCGGDRDRQKRPLMGEVASQYAQKIWLTDDNPRHESSLAIINDIQKGVDPAIDCYTEPDRGKAIEQALSMATNGDVVVIAGKGRERYNSVLCDHSCCDVDVVHQCLDL